LSTYQSWVIEDLIRPFSERIDMLTCVFVQVFSGKPVQKQPLCIEPDKQTFFLTRIDKFRQFGLRSPLCWKRRFDITIQGV